MHQCIHLFNGSVYKMNYEMGLEHTTLLKRGVSNLIHENNRVNSKWGIKCQEYKIWLKRGVHINSRTFLVNTKMVHFNYFAESNGTICALSTAVSHAALRTLAKGSKWQSEISCKRAKCVCHFHWHQWNIMKSYLTYLLGG